jgi:hypothetical protein
MAEQLKDLGLTEDGDIQIGGNGDLLVVRDEEVVAQEIRFRVKTTRGDWALYPECGADLELLIGLPNTPDTGRRAEEQVNRALTHDGFLGGELQEIRAVPVNREQLAVLIVADVGETPFTESVLVDLQEGVL